MGHLPWMTLQACHGKVAQAVAGKQRRCLNRTPRSQHQSSRCRIPGGPTETAISSRPPNSEKQGKIRSRYRDGIETNTDAEWPESRPIAVETAPGRFSRKCWARTGVSDV